VSDNITDGVADVAVIGAGIIGTCIAERLQSEGKKVLLIDRQLPGEGCSKGNAGHFATDIILPLANLSTLLSVPKLLLDPLGPLAIRASYFPKLLPWLIRFTWAAMPHKTKHTIEALKLLNGPSIIQYDKLLKRTGLEYLMTKRGALTVFCSEKAKRKNQKYAHFVRQHGVRVEELDGEQVRELEPALSQSIIGGLYYPDTAHSIDPYQLVVGLAEHFEKNGGKVIQQDVLSLDFDDITKVCLKTSSGLIEAKEVVIACGAWSKHLVKQVGHKVPLETERGYHLILPKIPVEVTRPVTFSERSFVMTPMAQGLRLAGTVELAGLDAPENYQRAHQLFNYAKEILPDVTKGEATTWMGHRPSLPDSLPVIGRSPKHNNIIFAFGHQHLGLTQAAVTADLLSEIVIKRAHSVNIDAFSVSRF
jgi:D-amino-acid dehydrogenase